MVEKDYIAASEIGEYIYCKRAWWLRLHGLLGENDVMREGTFKHIKLADHLDILRKGIIIAFSIILLGILTGIIYFLFINNQ